MFLNNPNQSGKSSDSFVRISSAQSLVAKTREAMTNISATQPMVGVRALRVLVRRLLSMLEHMDWHARANAGVCKRVFVRMRNAYFRSRMFHLLKTQYPLGKSNDRSLWEHIHVVGVKEEFAVSVSVDTYLRIIRCYESIRAAFEEELGIVEEEFV